MTKAIKFYIASKIILLCLPPHTTHILQPLDCGPFATLAIKYSRGILDRFQFATYNINKVDFLEIYQAARLESFTNEGVKKA
jgi:DDE superfamily endonuclease